MKQTETFATTKMLATFVETSNIANITEVIKTNYKILYDKIFVFTSDDIDKYILTYNIDSLNANDYNVIPSTIIVNRHKATNTIYTVNAVKKLMDSFVSIDWNLYQNSLLITQDNKIVIYRLEIFDVIHL